MDYKTILNFWFLQTNKKLHFESTQSFDSSILKKFYKYLVSLHTFHEKWLETPRSTLALIILVDQFPRNMFRGTKYAFYYDAYALSVCKMVIMKKRQWLQMFNPYVRMFYLLPLMHSENIDDQLLSCHFFKRYCPPMSHAYAINHYNVIHKYGRFPHRNRALQRKSTNAEKLFLKAEPNWPKI